MKNFSKRARFKMRSKQQRKIRIGHHGAPLTHQLVEALKRVAMVQGQLHKVGLEHRVVPWAILFYMFLSTSRPLRNANATTLYNAKNIYRLNKKARSTPD